MALNFESSKALISTSHCAIGMQLQSCNVLLIILKCDYYNRGHLDKVDQSDYRKITIYSEKVSRQS